MSKVLQRYNVNCFNLLPPLIESNCPQVFVSYNFNVRASIF